MIDKLINLIIKVAEDQNTTLPHPIEVDKKADAELYGPGSPLDSLGLVRLIVELEAVLEEQFGITVVLANEQAMSRSSSPFLTVASLATYVEEVIAAAGGHPAQ